MQTSDLSDTDFAGEMRVLRGELREAPKRSSLGYSELVRRAAREMTDGKRVHMLVPTSIAIHEARCRMQELLIGVRWSSTVEILTWVDERRGYVWFYAADGGNWEGRAPGAEVTLIDPRCSDANK